MLKKNKILLGLGTLVLLTSGSFTVIAMENKEEERIYSEHIVSESKDIKNDYATFTNEKDESKKLDYFKSMISEYNSYKKGNEKDETIIKTYDNYISKSKEFFKNENDKILSENSTKDIEAETKESLTEKTNALNTLKEKALNLEDIVYNGDEKEQFNNKVNEILKQYEEKIKQLDEAQAKVEAEIQAKVEAEAKVAIEAQAIIEAQIASEVQSLSVAEQQYNQETNSSYSNNYSDSNYTYVESEYNDNSYSETPSNNTSDPSTGGTRDYGWSASTEDGVKLDTWVEQSSDGHTYTVGTGNGTNDQDLGAGWIIP